MNPTEELEKNHLLTSNDTKLIESLKDYLNVEYVGNSLKDSIKKANNKKFEEKFEPSIDFDISKSIDSIVPGKEKSVITFKYRTEHHPLKEIDIRFKLYNDLSKLIAEYTFSGDNNGIYFEMPLDLMETYIKLNSNSDIKNFIDRETENIAINYIEKYFNCK